MSAPLYGLVLAGGRSERMGRDKALLSYDGEHSQLERVSGLLAPVCERVFVSMREEQGFPVPEGATAIHDSVAAVKGPLRGILSAMAAHPEADWLVVACDLPFLTVDALEALAGQYRMAEPELTAYRSAHDGLPEPLCAIYPAGAGDALHALAVELGKSCPRKLLIVKEARLIEQGNPRSLDNINTAEEYASVVNDQ